MSGASGRMRKRYEVRGPFLDRRAAREGNAWSVWDLERDYPVGYYPTREYARDIKRELDEADARDSADDADV